MVKAPDISSRPLVVGKDSGPEAPFPLRLRGPVIKGFGRGSSELGIPTANIPISGLELDGHSDIDSGIYFGWAALSLPSSNESGAEAKGLRNNQQIHPTVLSIGWNPYYKNTARSVEAHLIASAPIVSPTASATSTSTSAESTTSTADAQQAPNETAAQTIPKDFYGADLALQILGFIRPEYDYEGVEALVRDIRMDIEVARRSLGREAWGYRRD